MKLAVATAAALMVVTAACRGCDRTSARPDTASTWRPASSAGGALAPVAPAAMCVTLGQTRPLDGARFAVAEAAVRGVGVATDGRAAELRFVYGGPTKSVSKLSSGKVFRQLGLKLQAQDGCNVLYVMWRLEPATGVEVLVKKNPGQSVHSECGNRGYRKVKPASAGPVPALEPGSAHRLAAELTGSRLTVRVDGEQVLEADVGELGFAGPAGFRTDNLEAELELLAPASGAAARCSRGGD
jgi:hypothetical protein